MTLKELLDIYKGEISVDVKKITDSGFEDAITFKNTEAASIKNALLESTVSSYEVAVSSTVPAKACICVVVREEVTKSNDAPKSEDESTNETSEQTTTTTGDGSGNHEP